MYHMILRYEWSYVYSIITTRISLLMPLNNRCVVIDDQLSILPLSSHVKNLSADSMEAKSNTIAQKEAKLAEIKEQLRGSQPTEALVSLCKTEDQVQALLQFIDAITDKKLNRTVSLTAARGRGKSFYGKINCEVRYTLR